MNIFNKLSSLGRKGAFFSAFFLMIGLAACSVDGSSQLTASTSIEVAGFGPGAEVRLTGKDFAPNTAVSIYLLDAANQESDLLLGTVNSDDSGALEFEFRFPTSTLNVAPTGHGAEIQVSQSSEWRVNLYFEYGAVYDFDSFAEELRQAGLIVDLAGSVPPQTLSAPVQELRVNDEFVAVRVYPDTAAAAAEAAWIGPYGDEINHPDPADPNSVITVIYEWTMTPHWFYRENLIVFYAGDTQSILDGLETVLGSQFAGQETIYPTDSVPLPTAAIIPQTPVAETMSNDVEGWYLYQNETYAYRMSYPPAAAITLYSEDCLRTDLFDLGFLLITAVAVPNLPAACQPPQSTAAAQPEMIRLAGDTVMADKLDRFLFRAVLPNGLQIDFGLLPDVDPDNIDSQATLAVFGDMLDSIRFAQPVALAFVTPTPIPLGCLDETPETYTPPAGKLRIVYELDGQRWEWQEETSAAVLLPPEPTPEPEVEGMLSPDGRFLASLRQPDKNTFEIWVGAPDGGNSHQLITITPDDVYERYPQATGVQLQFGWVSESWISYRFLPEFDGGGLGEPPLQAIRVVDTKSGDTWTVLPPDVAWDYQFINDGQQIIALTEDGLPIIDTADGAIRYNIVLDVVVPFEQGIMFTPKGTDILVYTAAGMALVNPINGTFTEIPLEYVPVGMGHYSILPPQYWLENGTQFYTVTTANVDWGSPQASFTVWLVDTAVPSVTLLNTFNGFIESVELSPDRRRVIFWTQKMDNTRQLYLADVNTGEQFLYEDLKALEFIGWSPDSTQFLYKSFTSEQPILGHICVPPRPLTNIAVSLNGNVKWVDAQRLLVIEGTTGGEQPLKLVNLDGQITDIATLKGDYPVFHFYFEE